MNDKRRGADPYQDLSARQAGRSRAPIVIGVVIGLVVVALIAAVVLTSGGDGGSDIAEGTGAAAARDATQETATVTVQGEDLPQFTGSGAAELADPSTDDAVGRRIPKLTGQSFDGSEVVIDPDDGRPKVILFLAHWCPHCQAEVPRIQEWIDDGNKPGGVDIYAVSTAVAPDRPNYPPSNWIEGEGFDPIVLLDDESGTAATAYALPGFPYFVLVDADGNVVQRGSGEVAIEEFDAAVKKLAGSGS